jgi:alpha-L-rhamnosidase/Glycosyl hydrolases family 2, sugar binding domain
MKIEQEYFQDKNFTMKEFANPPSYFYPGYMWIINDKLDTEKIIWQAQDMFKNKAKSVCFIPEPHEFRPISFNTKFDVGYLGEKYFEIVQKIVAECDKLGMNWWLYDEGGWPSGGACGQVHARDPEKFAKKKMTYCDSPLAKDMEYTVPETVICAAVKQESKWQTFLPGEKIDDLTEDSILRVFFIENYPKPYGLPGALQQDPLNKEATETFIDLTHERYKKYVGEHFGKTIRFTFGDEPAVFHPSEEALPWTNGFEDIFAKRKGYRLEYYVPYLFKPQKDEQTEITQARIDYFDVWSLLFVENYLNPIKEWCHKNNLLSSGHFGGEDTPDGNGKEGYGHILRAMRGLDLPGIDVIWRQLFPGIRNHHFIKYASSVSRQTGIGLVMTESFAAFGNGLTPAQMKWVTDQQYLLGANLMVAGCYPYSTNKHLMVGLRPHSGPVNPLWKYMDIYHSYTARLGYLLSRGKPDCSIAFYFDIRSIWANGNYRKKAVELHDQISEILLNNQCDFDFIDDDTIQDARVEDGKLIVGKMQYGTVIIPETEWLETSVVNKLINFSDDNGKLLKIGNLKELENTGKNIKLNELELILTPQVKFNEKCQFIRVCTRRGEKMTSYFLSNTSDKELSRKCIFNEKSQPALCSLENGKFLSIPHQSNSDSVSINLTFQPYQSIMIVFGMQVETSSEFNHSSDEIKISQGWNLKALNEHRPASDDYEINQCSGQKMMATLGDWQKILGKSFSGDVVYSVEFNIDEQHLNKKATLLLGQVMYACEVIFNGEEIGRKIWEPFTFDVSSNIKIGKNCLEVIVTNTLANALLAPDVEKKWLAQTEPGWPSTGNPYDKMQKTSEKDSISSGLIGPVSIIFN